MGLTTIYNELQSLLTSFPEDARTSIISMLEDIDLDTTDRRNILGIYEPGTSNEVIEKTADGLVAKMNKLVKAFHVEMRKIIEDTEKEFRTKIRR